MFIPPAPTFWFMANHAHVAIKTESKEKILRLVAEAILSMFLFFFFFCILIKNPIADIDNWLSLEDPIALRHHIAVVLPFSSSHVLYTIACALQIEKENHR